jgi:hypothetical protein
MAESRVCRLCGRPFLPAAPATPAEQAGALLAAERYKDAGKLCGACLASRGLLAMMYEPDGRR